MRDKINKNKSNTKQMDYENINNFVKKRMSEEV